LGVVRPALRDELAAHRGSEQAAGRGRPGDRAFPTAGTPRDKDNARAKVMAPAVKRADELLVEGAERSAQALPVLLNPALPDE